MQILLRRGAVAVIRSCWTRGKGDWGGGSPPLGHLVALGSDFLGGAVFRDPPWPHLKPTRSVPSFSDSFPLAEDWGSKGCFRAQMITSFVRPGSRVSLVIQFPLQTSKRLVYLFLVNIPSRKQNCRTHVLMIFETKDCLLLTYCCVLFITLPAYISLPGLPLGSTPERVA